MQQPTKEERKLKWHILHTLMWFRLFITLYWPFSGRSKSNLNKDVPIFKSALAISAYRHFFQYRLSANIWPFTIWSNSNLIYLNSQIWLTSHSKALCKYTLLYMFFLPIHINFLFRYLWFVWAYRRWMVRRPRLHKASLPDGNLPRCLQSGHFYNNTDTFIHQLHCSGCNNWGLW